jgi:NAD(P)-dependent dehydrogenase (short-subunit alcohol dehydrogenase family)
MDFENKKIIVAGASGGIGGAICEALAVEGAVVIMIGRSKEKLRNQMEKLDGTGHRYYLCDFGQVETIESCVSQIISTCGPVDGLVHSAGVGDVRPLKLSKYPFMLNVMNVNFFSFVEMIRCITKKGCYNDGLSIVGISSIASQYGRQSRTAYSASKGAMDASMRTIAKELGVKGIRVNNVAPGGTCTSMIEEAETYLNLSDENRLNRLRQYLGECTPEDIANMVLFLLSDKARKITGTIVNVDGGKMSC